MPRPGSTKSSYTILPEQRLNLVRFTGSVSLRDIIRGTEQLWADPRYDPVFNGIVNLEGVTIRAGIEDVRALISFLQHPRSSSGFWAVVFTEPKSTALALVFKAAWKGSFRIEIVSTWEAACRFLSVNLPRPA